MIEDMTRNVCDTGAKEKKHFWPSSDPTSHYNQIELNCSYFYLIGFRLIESSMIIFSLSGLKR